MTVRSTPAYTIHACKRVRVSRRGSPQANPISSATTIRPEKMTRSSGGPGLVFSVDRFKLGRRHDGAELDLKFFKALLLVFIGEKPPTEDLKAGLLGGT